MRFNRIMICFLFTLFVLTGCSEQDPVNSGTVNDNQALSEKGAEKAGEVFQGESLVNSIGTPENDTSIGLKNIKIDNTSYNLTDEQRLVLHYFDNDYFSYPSYEFLRRYPIIFEDAQIYIWGTVKKIISLDANTVQMVLGLYMSDEWYTETGEQDYVLLTGSVGDISYMEGDFLSVYGRCEGIESIEFDGTSYTVPKVNMHAAYINGDKVYDVAIVKQIATTLLGSDFEIKKPAMDVDITGSNVDLYFPGNYDGYTDPNCLMVNLDDQSNAKLSTFLFGIYDGWIRPYRDGSDDFIIERSLEFTPDFSHFFLFTWDKELETLLVEYYDNRLEKIWKREFTGVTTTCYDYSMNNIYLSVNNELYIINTQTGEDTFSPTYVGEKMVLRKMVNGIFMVSGSQSDAIMMCGLDGSILWKADLSGKISYRMPSLVDDEFGPCIQLLGGNIVLQVNIEHDYDRYGTYSGDHYIVIDPSTGDILQDAIELQ